MGESIRGKILSCKEEKSTAEENNRNGRVKKPYSLKLRTGYAGLMARKRPRTLTFGGRGGFP